MVYNTSVKSVAGRMQASLPIRSILKSRFWWRTKQLGPEGMRGKGKRQAEVIQFCSKRKVSASPGRNLDYEVSRDQSWPWLPYTVGQAKDGQRAQIQIYANLQKAFWADLTSYVIKHTGGTFLLILSYLEGRMTQALRLNDCFLLPMYVYTHFIHPHGSFISIILYRI